MNSQLYMYFLSWSTEITLKGEYRLIENGAKVLTHQICKRLERRRRQDMRANTKMWDTVKFPKDFRERIL